VSEPRAPPSSYPGEHPARGRHAAFSSLLYSLIKQLAWPAIAPSDSHVSRRAALVAWLKRAAAFQTYRRTANRVWATVLASEEPALFVRFCEGMENT
jgi:hypothetical protein